MARLPLFHNYDSDLACIDTKKILLVTSGCSLHEIRKLCGKAKKRRCKTSWSKKDKLQSISTSKI